MNQTPVIVLLTELETDEPAAVPVRQSRRR